MAGPEDHRTPPGLALDFQVLARLRGYPEDLRRYTTLMKQAHPRGLSAAEFLLSRAGAREGFLEAVCRLVADGIDVVTAVEAAEMVGLPLAAAGDLAARPGFPSPLYGRGPRALWRRADVERYTRQHPPPGQPPGGGRPVA
jgi:hypothetical protein